MLRFPEKIIDGVVRLPITLFDIRPGFCYSPDKFRPDCRLRGIDGEAASRNRSQPNPGSHMSFPVQSLVAEFIAPPDKPVFPGYIPEMDIRKILFCYRKLCPELGKMGFCDTVLVIDLLYHELTIGIDRYGFPGKFLCPFQCEEDRGIFRSIIGGLSQSSGFFTDNLSIPDKDEPVCCWSGISP